MVTLSKKYTLAALDGYNDGALYHLGHLPKPPHAYDCPCNVCEWYWKGWILGKREVKNEH